MRISLLLAIGLTTAVASAQVKVTEATVLLAQDAGAAEKYAAKELVDTFTEMTGKRIQTKDFRGTFPPKSILVTNRSQISYLVPRIAPEEFVLLSKGRSLIVSGGS